MDRVIPPADCNNKGNSY